MSGKVTGEKVLEGYFLKPTHDDFWHHLMKVKKSEGIYENDKIEPRINEIILKKGFNTFCAVGGQGWTPSHVAVLSNNEAGLKFLKQRGALAADIKDLQGNTPIDLAKQFSPNLLKFFRSKVDLSSLENKFVSLPKKKVKYAAHTDDFGVEIKRLLFAKPSVAGNACSEPVIDHFAKNMVFYGKKFGFEVVFSNQQYALRDNLIRLPSGNVVTMVDSDNIQVGLDRCFSRALCFRDKAAFQTDHLFFKGDLGAARRHVCDAGADLNNHFDFLEEKVPTLRFYMEGGNHYVLSSLGRTVVLMGEDTLYISLNQMRRDGTFKDPGLDMSASIAAHTKKLSVFPVFLMDTLQEMYSQGLLSEGEGKKKGFISRDEITRIANACDKKIQKSGLYPVGGNPYLDLAKEFKHYSPLDLSELQKKNGIAIAAEYLAQKEFTKEIIALSFSVEVQQLVFVSQFDYHLDIFLRPGPSCIFIQDYSLSGSLLKEIASQAEALNLTPLDLEMLKRYLNTAEKLDRELGPLYAKVKAQLSAVGLPIVPLPALFYDVSPDCLNPANPNKAKIFNLNFLNAITGWSPKTQSYYYLAAGASVGDYLGKALMDSFEGFLKHYQPNIELGFLGFDPENSNDFSEGMRWLSQLGSQLGPHCLSFALETTSHLDQR